MFVLSVNIIINIVGVCLVLMDCIIGIAGAQRKTSLTAISKSTIFHFFFRHKEDSPLQRKKT
jgi:hypothetical protein